MGDWNRLYHWFECSSTLDAGRVHASLRRAASYRWLDSERWGLRFGFIGNSGRLLQAETVTKWGQDSEFGHFVIKEVPKVQLLQACAPHKFWHKSGRAGALDFQWNYLFVPDFLFLPLEQGAQLAGIGAHVRRKKQSQLLCLATPMSLPAASWEWTGLSCAPDADPLARLLEALTNCLRAAAHRTKDDVDAWPAPAMSKFFPMVVIGWRWCSPSGPTQGTWLAWSEPNVRCGQLLRQIGSAGRCFVATE